MFDKNEITVVLADDHPMMLKGLADELTTQGYTILGQGANGKQALDLILTHKPKIALLDIDMPLLTGFEVIKKAKEAKIHTKFIVLSFHKENEYVLQAKALEINGYLLKEDPFDDIEQCIDAVLRNEEFFSKSFESVFLKHASLELQYLAELTPSEITILKLVAQQITTSDIAENLFVSIRTVEKHRSNIIAKLNIEGGTNALTNWALINKNIIMER